MMDEKKVVPKRRFKGFDHEWKSTELGAIGSTFSGLSGKTKKDFGHGTAEFVTYMNVFNNSISNLNITEKVVRDDKQTQLKYGDILFTTSSETPNEVGMSSVWLDNRPNVYLNSFCFGLRPSKDIDYFFIAYLLRANLFRKQMEVLAQGISRYNISKSRVMEIKVNLPSLKEQQKIGEFFKVLDERIANQERKIAKVKALKTAYLTEMFPQEGETVPKRRFKGFKGEWGKEKLKYFGKTTSGTSIESEFIKAGKYKVISIGSYSQRSLYTDQNIRVNLTNKTKDRVLNKNDLTMILNDKTAEGNILGRVLLIEENDTYVYNQRTQRIEPNHEKYDSQFLYQMLNAPLIRSKIVKNSQGNTQIYINWSFVEEIAYLIPSKEEQQKIGQFFKNLDDQIATEEKKLEKLKKMKEAYLEEMFV